MMTIAKRPTVQAWDNMQMTAQLVAGPGFDESHGEALDDDFKRAVHGLRMALRAATRSEDVDFWKVEVNRAERARAIGNRLTVNTAYIWADLGEAIRADNARAERLRREFEAMPRVAVRPIVTLESTVGLRCLACNQLLDQDHASGCPEDQEV